MKNLIKLSMLLILGTSFILSEGCISGDCTDGYGTYVFSNGSKYSGDWKYDMRNGYGNNTYTSGAQYSGEYKND